ncbi:MAG: peptidoglycan D,D-transpeptidase FtsI family protein [Anaerolineae bacterium]
MNAEPEEKPYRRLIFLLAFLVGFALMLLVQLLRWQVLEHDQLARLAEQEHNVREMVISRRGNIFERNGYLLATDLFQYEVSAAPNLISNLWETTEKLAPYLNLSRSKLYEALSKDVPYVLLDRHVPQKNGEIIAAWNLMGITVQPRPKRIYPERELAAHLLGFVNETHKGYYGLEGYYDSILRGEEQILEKEKDPEGREILLEPYHALALSKGKDLVLTIDRTIQYMVERKLKEAINKYGAESGTIIVMDPRRGAILALANFPTFNPNDFAKTPAELFVNPAVSNQYEPGSVFKIITLAAGLDAGVITPNTTFYDGGAIEVGGRVIMNWDRQGHGLVDMTDVLAKSLNVGAAYVSTSLGWDRFYSYVRRFGFGRLTEVDLDGEWPGSLRLPGDSEWHQSDLGTNSFGQGIAVTPLQMINSVAAVANRGFLMKPYVVEKVIDGDDAVETKPVVVRRAISSEAAAQLTAMLMEAVEEETTLAAVPGYKIAGKTGTAQIPTPGGYDPYNTIASFIGYAPADDPQFIVLVKLDRPKVSPWGSQVAAPVFREVAEELFVYLDIPPDSVRLAYRAGNREWGMDKRYAICDIRNVDFMRCLGRAYRAKGPAA